MPETTVSARDELLRQLAARDATVDRMAREMEAVIRAVAWLVAGHTAGVTHPEDWGAVREKVRRYDGGDWLAPLVSDDAKRIDWLAENGHRIMHSFWPGEDADTITIVFSYCDPKTLMYGCHGSKTQYIEGHSEGRTVREAIDKAMAVMGWTGCEVRYCADCGLTLAEGEDHACDGTPWWERPPAAAPETGEVS